MEKLLDLVRKYTAITQTGFSIDISQDTPLWDAAIKQVGIKTAYRAMADFLCAEYARRFGREFLFSNKCVAYEIEYHVDAYMCATGYRGYIRNVTSMLFTKEELISHCEKVDISTEDVFNFKQKTMFRYKDGIRDCYKGTEADPYRNKN